MVGGARNGYCSKDSPRRVLSPSITMMIEMTMATMGRRMKKLAMALRPGGRRGRRRGVLDAHHLGLDLHAGASLLQTLDDDAIARGQPLVDDPQGADPLAGVHGAHLDGAVLLHHGDVVVALQLLDGALRDEHGVLLDFHGRANARVL